jgi:hypothetical protein
MKRADITRHLEQATGDLTALAATQGRARPTPIDGRLVLEHHPRLAWTMHDVDQWAQQGHPSGGGGGVRGGDSTPLPERLALVGKGDTFQADLLEAEVTLRQVTDGLRWLRAFQARNTPLNLEKRRRVLDGPAATCGVEAPNDSLLQGCGAVITNVGEDRVKRGLCPKCYKRWLRSFEVDTIELGDAAHFG